MNGHQIKSKWLRERPVIAGWAMIGHPENSKILAQSGVDAVVLDWQHGLRINEASVVDCIESISNEPTVAPLVRVPAQGLQPYPWLRRVSGEVKRQRF